MEIALAAITDAAADEAEPATSCTTQHTSTRRDRGLQSHPLKGYVVMLAIGDGNNDGDGGHKLLHATV